MKFKTKYLLIFCLAMGLVGLGALNPALASDEGPSVALPGSAAIDATPTLTINSAHLSNKQFGSTKISVIRPGEYIYGVYSVTLSGASTDALIRKYNIWLYSQRATFWSAKSPGTVLFSWGFQIPENKAKHGTQTKFKTIFQALGGNTVARGLAFTIKRYGLTDSTRAYFSGLPTWLKNKIINNCKAAKNYLLKSALAFKGIYYSKSADKTSFLNRIKSRRQNAYLIHSHGSDTDGGRIYFLDNTYVNGSDLTASGFKAPGGLFYAAVCKGATYTTLGNAFLTCGCKGFIGYTVSVYTSRNADFYKEFFRRATKKDMPANRALAATIKWAYAKGWNDVTTARYFGSHDLYLGGQTGPGISSASVDLIEMDKVSQPAIVWKDITTYLPSQAEHQAVHLADAVPAVQALKSQYGALTTGIEVFPSVYRVSYKAGDIFLYGVDVDKKTGTIVEEGTLD
ncbi:MAG: hypothetical protein JRI57_07385 [Deltaproteobacteria bacterium]|nr:hypothetical protein [Deltaproteobacteria bacterium]MBW1953799.1 hypothetical protein [Deltaproteobacteria bacterium]